jgi:hypothetical protein
MKKQNLILDFFLAICNNSLTQKNLNHLIELMQKTAYAYLRHRFKNKYKILLSEDVSLNELAIDSIALLFKRDETGCFIKLKSAFESWQPQITTEQEAEYFLNKLVAKSVDQYITEILRGSDPFFAKILNSVIYLASKENLIKKHFLGTSYYLEKDEVIFPARLPDVNFISSLPDKLFFEKDKMFKEIFAFIKSNSDYFPAIPLNALVLRIKEIKSSEYEFPGSFYQEWEFEIDSLVDKALKTTFEKLNTSYGETGKLNENEIELIEKAFESIATDMKDGGLNPGLYKYLIEKHDSLTIDEYRQKYQFIFEYLFKLFKKNIINELEKK